VRDPIQPNKGNQTMDRKTLFAVLLAAGIPLGMLARSSGHSLRCQFDFRAALTHTEVEISGSGIGRHDFSLSAGIVIGTGNRGSNGEEGTEG
jgi:hypothetical protein